VEEAGGSMKTLSVSLTANEIESILDVLEHAEENELFDRLSSQFSAWYNEKDDTGNYINRDYIHRGG
jgi:hypothetical protein